MLSAALGAVHCSAIDNEYLLAGYGTRQPVSVKRIAVAGWAPASEPKLAELLAHVGTDLIRLHTNYLAHDPVVAERGWESACGELEGVLLVRLLEIAHGEGAVQVRLELNLLRCSDGRLLWRVAGGDDLDPADEDLADLVAVYGRRLGGAASRYAGPAFVLLKDLLQDIPNPQLTEEEELEKIELGSARDLLLRVRWLAATPQ